MSLNHISRPDTVSFFIGVERKGMKQVATPKQTAGGGYAFEDKVVGYYLAWMLTGSPPFARADRRGAAPGSKETKRADEELTNR